jgi:hypothetical protein
MNDKPMMQFKLSIADSDALRAMIQRDHADALSAIKTNRGALVIADREKMTEDATRLNNEHAELQRRLMKVEHLADIFSVNLGARL